jgi:hypothetical protein
MLNKSKDAVKLEDCAKKLETKSAKPPWLEWRRGSGSVFDRKPPRLEWRRGSGSWVFDRLEEQGSLYDTDVTTLVHAMDNELSSLCVRSVMDVNSGSNTDIVLNPKTLFHVNEAGAVPFIKKKKTDRARQIGRYQFSNFSEN